MSKASNTLHDASIFEVYGGPVPLAVEIGSANAGDETGKKAITLFLSHRGSKAVGAGITVQAEQSKLVNHCIIQSEKTMIGCSASSRRKAKTTHFIARMKSNLVPFLSRPAIGHIRRAILCRNLRK